MTTSNRKASDAPRLLWRDGRPGRQEDLPRAARDGEARPPRRARHRRRPQTRGRVPVAAEGEPREARRPDPAAFAKLSELVRYVRGSYEDAATFQAIRRELGPASRPAYYLAIPPSQFGVVVDQLNRTGCLDGARVIVEKPFGRDLASARRAQRHPAPLLPENGDLPHRPLPGQGRRCRTCCSSASRNAFLEPDLEPELCRERADHDGGELRRAGPGRLLRGGRRHPRRRAEPPAPGS